MFDNVLSDYLWAKAVVLTTPTVATIGLSLTIPLAVLSDWILHHTTPAASSISACACVLLGLFAIDRGSRETEQTSESEPFRVVVGAARPDAHDDDAHTLLPDSHVDSTFIS